MNRPMTLCDILPPNAVLTGIEASDKKKLLSALAHEAAQSLELEEHVVCDILLEREKLGTTGIGHGIAIPHGRIPGLSNVRGFFTRLTPPLSFDAVDDRPVDLVFLLLAPEEAGADHLHALATVSRVLRDQALCEALRKAKDSKGLIKLLRSATVTEAA